MEKSNSQNSSDSIIEQKNTELNKLRLVFEQTPGAIFILDTKFRFEYVNPGYEKLSGFSKSELIGKSVAEIFQQTDYTEPREEIIRNMIAGTTWEGEMQTYRKDGSTYWATTVSSPFRNDSGHVEGYIIIQQDVSERKKIEIALRESEKFYRTLIESSMDAVSINQYGKFLLVNSAFCTMFGYTNEEIFNIEPKSFIAPEDRERVMDLHYKRMQGGIDKQHYTAYFLHKSGKRVLTELNATTVQVNGRNASFITMSDITERNEMENALRESQTKYKTLVENSHDGIMIVRDNRILFANDTICDMMGYCLADKSVDIIHPDDRHKMIAIGERRRNGDLSTIHESIRMLAKNGEIKECETTSTMIKFEGEWAAFYTVHDVTQRNRFEEELKDSEEKYRQLFAAESDAIFMIDAETGEILDANPATTSIYGYSHEELLKMKNTDISAEPEKTAVATKNNETRVNHRLHKRKDGTVFPVELSAGFTNFKNRKIQIVTSRDITDRIKAQEELAKSEQKYRELAEMLPLAVYELDVHGKPTYMNRTGLKLFGWDKNVASNMDASSFFSPEDKKLMQQRLEEEAKKMSSLDEPTDAEPSIPEEYTAISSTGEKIPVIIYGAPIIENGKAVGSRGVIVDISERKAMENALRESEEKYKTLIENSQDGIFAIIDDKILFANNTFCKLVGYTSDELYNKSAVSLVLPDDRAKGLAISERRKQGDHSTVNDIFRFVDKDGSVKEGDVFSSVMELNGQIVSYITVHDLTETRKIQEELIKSEQKYRELAEMLPQTVYELDLNANLRYLNKAGREKFGTAYETGDVSVFSIVVPEQLEQMKNNFSNVSFKSIPSKGNFYKLRQVDGQIFEAMISATPMIVDGKTIGQRGVVIDISDHVAMQNALRESEEKYRTLIENATDGIVIVQNGLLKFANQTMCDIMKYKLDELIEKPFLDYIDNADHELLNKFHNRRMNGEQFSNILRSQFIRKDGKLITVELNARTSNYNGSPAGFIVIRDITDRLKIENELQFAKNELEKLNSQLEKRVKESSKRLTEARTQLINLQKENLQSQYDVLKQQVNPHFLFNSLNVLTSLIKLEPDLAEKFSEQLSKVYRYVLENKDNELVDLQTELNFLDAYIFLLNIRFVGKLIVNLTIPNENRNDSIIPLAMQLLIENAIKHNVMSKSNPLIIDIFIDSNNCLNIINNLQERPSQIVSTGVGLKNILNRYQLLNLTAPVFEKTENQFIAKIQLVKSSNA